MLTGIHHIAYIVDDFEEGLVNFEALFDLEPAHRMRRDDEFVLETVLYHAGEHYIEFIGPISERGWAYEYLDEHGEGFFHVSYEVEDLEASIGSLRDQGIDLVTEEPQTGVGGAWELISLAPDETVVPTQLVEDERSKDNRDSF